MINPPDKIDKISFYLFNNQKEGLTKVEQEIADRYKDIFSYWLEKPFIRDAQMVEYVQSRFGLSHTQAYHDLHSVKLILGNVRNAGKEWQRYKAIYMIDRGYELIENATDKFDVDRGKAMIKAGEALGKVTMLDKEDIERPNWKDFIASKFEPSDDAQLVGWKSDEPVQDTMERLKQKYGYYENSIVVTDAKIITDEQQ